MIIRVLLFLLHFTVIPMAVGSLITYRLKTHVIADYLVGFFGNLAIFYVLYSIVEWIQNWSTFDEVVIGGFTLLLKLYCIVIVILVLIWILLERKKFKKIPNRIMTWQLDSMNVFKSDKYVAIYMLMFAILLAVQLYMAFAYQINEWSYDDYDYVVTSKDTIETDTLSYVNFIDGTMPNVAEKRAVASWGTYVSMLAKTTGFEVTTVYHSILPVFLLLLAYSAHFYISTFFFKKGEDKYIFLTILSVGYIFGLYSHYSLTFRLLGAIWQGKAVLSVIAIPFFMIFLIEAYSKDDKKGYFLPILATSLGMCSLTSLSLMVVPVEAVFIWVVMCIYKRKLQSVSCLIASLIGPLYVGVFYAMIWMLQQDMQSNGFKYFKFRTTTNRWEKWFR